MNAVPWWGWLIIAIVSGAFLSWLVALWFIVAGARAELKRAKTRAKLDDAMRRHPSHRSRYMPEDPFSKPPF